MKVKLNVSMLEALRLKRHRGIDILILLAREGKKMTKDEIVENLRVTKGDETRKWVDRLVKAGWLERTDEWPRKYLLDVEKLKIRLFSVQ